MWLWFLVFCDLIGWGRAMKIGVRVPDASGEGLGFGFVVVERVGVEGHAFGVVLCITLADEFEIDEEHVRGAEDIGGSTVDGVAICSWVELDVDGFAEKKLLDESARFDRERLWRFGSGLELWGVCAQKLVPVLGLPDLEQNRVRIKDSDDLGKGE